MILYFVPDSNKAKNGVLSYFLSLQNQSIHNLVQVDANDFEAGYDPSNILYTLTLDYWRGLKETPDSYISVHLIKHKLLIKNYTIRQYDGLGLLKDWILEGSNNGNDWITLDHQSSNNFCVAKEYFTLSTQEMTFSYFRFRQTNVSCYGNYHMRLAGVELFGNLIPLSEHLYYNRLSYCFFHMHSNPSIHVLIFVCAVLLWMK